MKVFALFALMACVAVARSQVENPTLQCYSCSGDECDDLTSDMLITCHDDDDTTTPPPAATTTTPAPTDTTTETTVATTVTTEPTTVATVTTTVTTEPTTVATVTTTVATEPTTVATESTTVATEPTTEATVTTAETTVTTVQTDAPGRAQNAIASSGALRQVIVRQSSPAAQLIRNYRSISRTGRALSMYFCYTINVQDGDSTKEQRGCSLVPSGEAACPIIEAGLSSPSNCKVCQTDGCNSGAMAFKLSAAALLAAIIVKFLM